MNPHVLCAFGTRPEVIKMAPVVKALREQGFRVSVLATAQHRGLLDQMMATFGLHADWDLDAMQPNQTLASLTGRLVPALDAILREAQPDLVLAQGDTTTVFCTALASFYAGIPFGHVEAGLRSGDLAAPFPEEGMRRLSAVLTRWHFAPTETSRSALLREGVPDAQVHVVGNTVIDALLEVASRADLLDPLPRPLGPGERLVLVTLHRRENFGEPLRRILEGLKAFAGAHPEARFLYPVHPNPNVTGPAREILGGVPNVHLVDPLDYPALVSALKQAFLVLTDSGGLQEEAPALGKPVLVFREVTERPEAVEAGGVLLVGSDTERFRQLAERIWKDEVFYSSMGTPRFPYGDGKAANQIASILKMALSGRVSMTTSGYLPTVPQA
ncbi:non-hydrolyzing UDP-N-acetylglucosamine 2-epimerase [Geothrix alkalitolerans]|uniref:non-hydrolyzing UDP-N-acetylglucosamine 2-epimerase n=1 Tax=Geothrix alkalitolerans TaxID=2922724 RepID=UPI001FAF0ED2|nr:UDP-N-acetylglucosamine 2-epimerase (non-hydrolyzing) [Geothrix alkalitolerans]